MFSSFGLIPLVSNHSSLTAAAALDVLDITNDGSSFYDDVSAAMDNRGAHSSRQVIYDILKFYSLTSAF